MHCIKLAVVDLDMFINVIEYLFVVYMVMSCLHYEKWHNEFFLMRIIFLSCYDLKIEFYHFEIIFRFSLDI